MFDYSFLNPESNFLVVVTAKFTNFERLIAFINRNKSRYNITVQMSTLAEFFDSQERDIRTYPEYSQDFFPYSDQPFSPWVGFYTSRPVFKVRFYLSSVCVQFWFSLTWRHRHWYEDLNGDCGQQTFLGRCCWRIQITVRPTCFVPLLLCAVLCQSPNIMMLWLELVDFCC